VAQRKYLRIFGRRGPRKQPEPGHHRHQQPIHKRNKHERRSCRPLRRRSNRMASFRPAQARCLMHSGLRETRVHQMIEPVRPYVPSDCWADCRSMAIDDLVTVLGRPHRDLQRRTYRLRPTVAVHAWTMGTQAHRRTTPRPRVANRRTSTNDSPVDPGANGFSTRDP